MLSPSQFLEGDTETSITNQTSRPYKTPSRHVPKRPLPIFTIVFRIKHEEAIFLKTMYALHLPFPTF
jgi:hypothetical protein